MKKRWRNLYNLNATFICPYCMRKLPISQSTKEHEPPQSRQHELGPSKIILACGKCNHKKGALSAEEYAEWNHLENIRNGLFNQEKTK